MQDKREELYKNLIGSGRVSENEIGTLEQFKAAITDEKTAREFHDNLINAKVFNEGEIGNADDFYGSISSDFSTPSAVERASQAVQNAAQSVKAPAPAATTTPAPVNTTQAVEASGENQNEFTEEQIAKMDRFSDVAKQAKQIGALTMSRAKNPYVTTAAERARVAAEEVQDPTSGNSQPMTEDDRMQALANVDAIGRQMDYSTERYNNQKRYTELKGKKDLLTTTWKLKHPFVNKDVVKDGDTFITSIGNRYDNPWAASAEQSSLSGRKDAVADKALKKAISEVDKKNKELANPSVTGHYGGTAGQMFAESIVDLRKYNEQISPERLWEQIGSDDFVDKLLKDENLIQEGARKAHMSVDDYVRFKFIPELSYRLAKNYESYLTEDYDVKSAGEYFYNRMLGSLMGSLYGMAVYTDEQRRLQAGAVERSHEGISTGYNPGFWGRLGGEAAMFGADTPILIGTGAFGGFAAKTVGGGLASLGSRLGSQGLTTLGRVAASGNGFIAANVGRATKWGGLAINRAVQGTGLGLFMGSSSAVQNISIGDGGWSTIGHFLEGFGEGAATGAILGLTTLGSAASKSRIAGNGLKARATRAGITAATFMAENQLFANMDRFREGDFDWVDSSMDAFYMQLAGKISSPHGLQEQMHAVKRLLTGKAFGEKPKSGLDLNAEQFRLTDQQREEIQRAFAGMDLDAVAAKPENVGKILSDKENISWVTRQKVAGSMGFLESYRPRTSTISIRGNKIYERGADGELIEVHEFKDANEASMIRQQIEERKANDDMFAYLGILDGQKPEGEPDDVDLDYARMKIEQQMKEKDPNFDASTLDVGKVNYRLVQDFARDNRVSRSFRAISDFAFERGMEISDVYDIIRKRPIERTDEEVALVSELANHLHDVAFPKDEYHPAQSNIDGQEQAGSEPVVKPDESEALAMELKQATDDLNNFLSGHSELAEKYNSLRNEDAPTGEILRYIADNYSGSERDEALEKIAEYENAKAKRDGYMLKKQNNIDEYVAREIDQSSFSGHLNGDEDVSEIITVTDGTNNYTLISAEAYFDSEGRIDLDRTRGAVVVRDENGKAFPLTMSNNIRIVDRISKEDYGNKLRDNLIAEANNTLEKTGVIGPDNKEGQAGGNEGQAETAALQQPTQTQEPTKPQQTQQPAEPQQPTVSIDSVKDKDGVKHYEQGIDIDAAISDLQADGFDPNLMSQGHINKAQKQLDKINKKIADGDFEPKDLMEQKRLQGIVDYWTRLKERYTEQQNTESNLNVEPAAPIVPENNVPLQPQAATDQQEPAAEPQQAAQTKHGFRDRLKELAARYKKKFGEFFNDDIDVPYDATELVAMNIGTGRQFQWEDKPDGTRGFKAELGIDAKGGGRRGSDSHAFAHLFKGQGDNTGLGFREFVDKVWRSDENVVKSDVDGMETHRFTDSEIANAVIDLFMSAESGKDITEYIIRNRVEKAQKAWEAEQARLKEEAERNEKIDLTEEEVAQMDKEKPFSDPTEDDFPELPKSQQEKLVEEVSKILDPEVPASVIVIDSKRTSDKDWYDITSEALGGVFPKEKDIQELKDWMQREDGGYFFVAETGKLYTSDHVSIEKIKELYKEIKEAYGQSKEKKDITDSRTGETDERVDDTQGKDGSNGSREGATGGNESQGEGHPEPGLSERDVKTEAGEKGKGQDKEDYLVPRNDKEKQIVADVEQKLEAEIKAAEEEVKKAKSAYEKARSKESDRATDMFSDDKAFEKQDQLFSFEEMGGTDRTQEGVNRRTEEERERLKDAQEKLDKLQSKAEHDSRVRGALENERKQTSFDDIDKRHKEEYDKYIKPLLGLSDEQLRQMAKKKEDAVNGDMKQLEGDLEYSAIQNVLLQREYDRQHNDVKLFIENTIDDKDVTFVDKLTPTEFDKLHRLIDEKGVDDPGDKIQDYVNRLRKKYPVEKSDIEQDKKIGITHNETPEQKADRERAEKLADTPLTDAEVDTSSASDVQKTLAKAYLNGNHGLLQEAAYLNVYNDVRNRRQDGTGDSSDADRTQLDSSANSGERRPGQAGEPNSELASGPDVPGQNVGDTQGKGVQRSEDSKNDVPVSSGEGGDSRVSESKPEVDGLSSGGGQPVGGSGIGSNGGNVRPNGTDKRSRGMAGRTGERENKADVSRTQKPAAGSDAAIAASKQRLAELRKKFKDAGRNGTISVSLVGMNNEQIGVLGEIITESANLGYQYLVKGMRDFNEWRKQMLSDFKDWLQEDFKWTDNDVDEYIREVWNCEYNIDGVTRTIGEWASFIGEKELKKVVKADMGTKFEQQKAAENIDVKVGDIDNIRETLPYLLPEQQDDVLKAETQFFNEAHQDREHGNGKGMMFTNGTGTGKTYTGLGVVKRFVRQGKGRVLILTPSQEKVNDWRKDGLNLGLNIESLDEEAKMKGTSATKSKGKGVVVTTYANARQNLALLEDCFDLIVYDESHKIMESKDATNTTMLEFHEMLTNKNVERSIDRQTYWLPLWVEERNLRAEQAFNEEVIEAIKDLDADQEIKIKKGTEVYTFKGSDKEKLQSRNNEIGNRLVQIHEEKKPIRESKREQAGIDTKRTKTVFLSATPFNVRESLRYAEGYIFSFPDEDKNTVGSYNHRSPEDAFLESTFPGGYRWRYGRLENHVSNAEALSRQEVDFSDYLQKTLETMSGRMIASDYDYSRDFPVLTLDHAGRFNQAMSEVYRNRRYQALAEAFRKSFDYNYSTALFEAMKTSLVNDRIKEHLARGQKVVVFHRRRTSGDLEPPFQRALNLAEAMASAEPDGTKRAKIKTAIDAFKEDFADMLEWEKTIDYSLPREQIENRFGKDKVAFFSGAETKGTKHKSVEDFMKDNGGKDIIVIQEASGKEGISLHDQTGEHQRVEINLALPQSPIAFIQIEGRIYRIGQKSNAIFEYPLLGLDLETNLFAQKFNGALGTTENLALGSKARNLRQSIANSVLENTGEVDYDRQGYGGKDMDGRVSEAGERDGFDASIQDYYGNQKMQRGRDNREGVDYFPTPEPIGYKMVEFGQMLEGESALEPSAGHGAIARYVPETNAMTAIEPSSSLFTKLQMRAGGPGRRFEEKTFEEYPLVNKHDVILMNPPYGVGGKTAMEHVAKAFKHLNEGGRIVAIIPDGPAMQKRLDAWLNSYGENGVNQSAVVTGEINLPGVAFGRAGTNVRTKIVVIDKVSRAEMRKKVPEKVTVDLSSEESIGGLFDRIRDVRMPERTIDVAAINEKRARRTQKNIEENPFTRTFQIENGRLYIYSKERNDMPEINMSLENPMMDNVLSWNKMLKDRMEHPETIAYGKYAGKTYGSGKNKVPATDAIRDYCQQVIKTLENITGVTSDQMDRMYREKQEAEAREREEARKRYEQQQQEALNHAKEMSEIAIKEDYDKTLLDENAIRWNMRQAYTARSVNERERAKRYLRNGGIDWETGKKITKKTDVLESSYNEEMPLDLETMQRLMNISEISLDHEKKMAAKKALEMSGVHSDTGEAKEGFDYSSHDQYYEKELRELLDTVNGSLYHLETKQQRQEREAAAMQQRTGQGASGDFSYKLDKNTKTGADMHLVAFNGQRMSDADYRATERKAKAAGGYYNRFKKAFHFPSEADARRFMESVNASNGNDGSPQTRFRLREKEAPKKTKKVYKLMRLGDDGKLYPLFIDAAAPTELGKWYDADSPDVKNLEGLEPGFAYKIDKNGNVVDSKPVNRTKTTITGLPNVQKINDATNEESRWITVTTDKKGAKSYHNVGINGSGQPGTFAMRPGWHAGSLPSMRQIGKGRDRNLRDDRFVWVEGEVPDDREWQTVADQNPNKDIPTQIPEDGYYMKATNANKAASQADRIGWYVAGAFKANRIMSDVEARNVITKWNKEHPDQQVEYDFERESGKDFNAETMQLEDRPTTRFRSREADEDATTRFRFAKDKEEFDKIREDAVSSKGLVVKGLNDAEISITHVDNHEFGDKPIDKARDWANKNLVTSDEDITKGELPKMKDGTPYVISKKAVGKYLSEDGMASSDNQNVHLSVLKRLKDVISESIEAEVHPDYQKVDGVRTTEKYNDNALIHRLYGAVEIDGKVYRVKTTMQEFRGSEANKPHSYEVTKIELLDSPMTASESPSVNVGQHKTDTKESTNNSISGAKLLKDVEKSYDSGKKLLDESKKSTFFRKREQAQTPQEADFLRKEEAGRKLAKKLNSDFEAITDKSQIKNKEVLDAIARGEEPTGWIEIDEKTGKKKIFMYLPNVRDTYEAEQTIAHEVIGHYGLRELLGDKGFRDYMRSLAFDLKDPALSKYMEEHLSKNGFDIYRTIDEFLAEAAEKGYGDISMWQKVRNKITDALRSVGFTMAPSISDVKYMTWLSKHRLEKGGDAMGRINREALLFKLGRERYEAKVKDGEYTYDNTPNGTEGGDAPYFPGNGETLFRHTPSVKNQRLNYEKALRRIGYAWKEAHIDHMQAAVELMRAISGVKKIEEIPSSENFVLLENQMSSKEEQMDYLFNRDFMKPLDDAVGRCLPDMGNNTEQQLRNLQIYMIKKHGLERNRVLFVRDAIRELRNDGSVDQKQVDDLEQDYNDTMRDLRDDLNKGNINLKEFYEEIDAWIRSHIASSWKAGEKDYSGLSSLKGGLKAGSYDDEAIIDEVMGIEGMLGEERVNDLWDKTRAVSQFGLDMEYEGGLDSKAQHDRVSNMFEWYVPLRGYDEKTAEDMYDYLEEHGSGRQWAGPVLMNAKGHKHLSDVDVFATLGAMSSGAINRMLRNQMKQSFARFIRNHYKDTDATERLVTELPYLWAEKQYDAQGNEIWVESFPNIPENAKADDVAQILDQYKQDMEAKAQTGDAKRIRQNANLPFRVISPEHKAQHIVDVWINGEKHSFIINGNPRAAQAINGQLKAERNSNILWLSSLSHFMAKMNTSYSPDFIKRNTERDLFYSAANIAIKENYKYWFTWAKNYALATGRAAFGVPAMHTNLFKRYRKGELNPNNQTDRYFKEFMENGGETGWVERKNIDKWKKEILKGVRHQSTPEKAGRFVVNMIPDAIEAMNERAENLARFATYMTSRQMGRSVTRSVSDAKEVSVNFNRKGAGSKTVGIASKDSRLRSANAYLAGWSAQHLQDYFMFYNAGVQGINNMTKNLKNHPIKGATAFSAFALAAMLMPRLNQFLYEEDDDKTGKEPENPYAEIPEWQRRNNLCIYTDKGTFITIALPIELRAMYGLGDMAASYISNPELRSTKNAGEDILTLFSQISPLDFFGENAGAMFTLIPSGLRPFAEIMANKDWLGRPIEREGKWLENKPRWTRAYKNVNDLYVGISKKLNAATNPYDDENIKGWADGWLTDPAYIKHMVDGLFGGAGTSVTRLASIMKGLFSGEMSLGDAAKSGQMPVLRTFHYTPDERTRYARTRNRWFYYKKEADQTEETIKVLKKRGETDPVSYMKSVSEDEGAKGARAQIMKDAEKQYKKIEKAMDKTDDLEQVNIYQMQLDSLMENTVKELDKIK